MRLLIFILLNSIISLVFSQEKKFIRQGNSSYGVEDYENSELKYRKALEKKNSSFDAGFNLGDALFKQEKYDEAIKQFENLSQQETTKENTAKAYHNLGNSLLQAKDEQGQPKLEEAVEAYKNALRNNPKDNETRFNLAQAQKMLQQQQQQQQQQNKDDKKQDPPSEYAKMMKNAADNMVAKFQFRKASELMKTALEKDATVANYNGFIEKIDIIIEIKE